MANDQMLSSPPGVAPDDLDDWCLSRPDQFCLVLEHFPTKKAA